MKRLRATVSPLGEMGGKAPSFEERSVVEERAQSRISIDFEGTTSLEAELEATERVDEFHSGQHICERIGGSVTNLKNAGTLLAWMVVQCMLRGERGPWRWLATVLFESSAAGHEKPVRAVSFPMRRGDLEDVFLELGR